MHLQDAFLFALCQCHVLVLDEEDEEDEEDEKKKEKKRKKKEKRRED